MIDFVRSYFHDLGFALAFAALIAFWFLLKRLPGWTRSLVGGNWPTTEGRVETVNVKVFGEQALAELGYSYVAEGNRYSGYYSQQFADEQHAWDYVKRCQGQLVVVRYKRDAPDLSALRATDQQSYVDLKGTGFFISAWQSIFDRLREFYPRRL